MAGSLYPPSSREPSERRRALAPETEKAFQAFGQRVLPREHCPGRPSSSLLRRLLMLRSARNTSGDAQRRPCARALRARN